MPQDNLVLSICICTYNRCESLKITLRSLAKQHEIPLLAEVLVVDNNSDDATRSVTDEFHTALPIRVVHEKKQGLSHARNRAVAESRGDVLLFTDDDVVFDADWLSAYARACADFPAATFFGGRILPDWGGEKPRWLAGECLPLIDGVVVWYDHGTQTRLFTPNEPSPFGASFAVRRRLLEEVGGFRTDLGRAGASLGRGEETDFFLRAKQEAAEGVYVGRALCWHRIDRRRLKLWALYRYGIESGKAHKLITGTHELGSLSRVPLHVARGLGQLLRGRGDRFRQSVINAGIEVGMRQVD